MTLEEFASHFDQARLRGKEYRVCCPVHGDKNPSAYITEKNGNLLGHCFSCGANGLDMARALKIDPKKLFHDRFAPQANYLLTKTRESDDFLIYSVDLARAKGERIKFTDAKAYREAMARRNRRAELNIPQNIMSV